MPSSERVDRWYTVYNRHICKCILTFTVAPTHLHICDNVLEQVVVASVEYVARIDFHNLNKCVYCVFNLAVFSEKA